MGYILQTSKLQLSVGGRRESPPRQLSGLQIRGGGDVEREVTENNQDYNENGVLFEPRHLRFRGSREQQQRPRTHLVAVAGPATMEPRVPEALHQQKQTNKLCGFSPQANYTDRATAACRS
jgi:hypothetical protein